jgi:hypothetical protein
MKWGAAAEDLAFLGLADLGRALLDLAGDQGLTIAHFKAQLEDLREHISPVRAQLEHLQATSTD